MGVLNGDEILFPDMTITSGAGYGDSFDQDDVVRTSWGSIRMSFDNCNSAELHLQPILAGFEDISLNMTRILPTTCGGGGVSSDALPWMGAFYDSARDGEGFHFGVEENGIYVMTWYTYLDGVQVWMIGTGTRNGNRVVFVAWFGS